jgi:hypothetical protein
LRSLNLKQLILLGSLDPQRGPAMELHLSASGMAEQAPVVPASPSATADLYAAELVNLALILLRVSAAPVLLSPLLIVWLVW